jgi:hypothetical protein
MTFHVGDKVKVVNSDHYLYNRTGTVWELFPYEDEVLIDLDLPFDNGWPTATLISGELEVLAE